MIKHAIRSNMIKRSFSVLLNSKGSTSRMDSFAEKNLNFFVYLHEKHI